LAVVLALVRPGKKHLIRPAAQHHRLGDLAEGRDGYVFKKAHAVAYAALVVVAMNLLCERLMDGA
jgi:DNA polymerase III alpha subunit